MLPNN
jgi:hypothetical protein